MRLPKTTSDKKLVAPGGRGRVNRKHRTTGQDPCSCGLLGCDPSSPLPAKVRARRAAGKCMGCGNEKAGCTCKRKAYIPEPYHFKSPEERESAARRKRQEEIMKKNLAKWDAEKRARAKKSKSRKQNGTES